MAQDLKGVPNMLGAPSAPGTKTQKLERFGTRCASKSGVRLGGCGVLSPVTQAVGYIPRMCLQPQKLQDETEVQDRGINNGQLPVLGLYGNSTSGGGTRVEGGHCFRIGTGSLKPLASGQTQDQQKVPSSDESIAAAPKLGVHAADTSMSQEARTCASKRLPRLIRTKQESIKTAVQRAIVAHQNSCSISKETSAIVDMSSSRDLLHFLAATLSIPVDREVWIFCDSLATIESLTTRSLDTGYYRWRSVSKGYLPGRLWLDGMFQPGDVVDEILYIVEGRLHFYGCRTWVAFEEESYFFDGESDESEGDL